MMREWVVPFLQFCLLQMRCMLRNLVEASKYYFDSWHDEQIKTPRRSRKKFTSSVRSQKETI